MRRQPTREDHTVINSSLSSQRHLSMLGILFCLWSVTPPTAGDILNVPDAYATIQSAIDAALPGDEVVLADGVYAGAGNKNLDFVGKAITVRSASGDASACVIDCEDDGRGFYFHSGEPAEATVRGLTIRYGYVPDTAPYFGRGGGICCEYSSPTITNNTIVSNTSYLYGGGIYLDNSTSIITDNTILENRTSRAFSAGGGLYLLDSDAFLMNNEIVGNLVVTNDGAGGGLCLRNSNPSILNNRIMENGIIGGNGQGCGLCLFDSSPIIADNIITYNHPHGGCSGGGLYLSTSCAVITNNLVAYNSVGSSGQGGGFYLSTSSPTLTCNTVTDNSAERGGGLYLLESAPIISRNTVFCNIATYGAGLYLMQSSPMIANNLVFGNSCDRGGGLYLDDSAPTIANNTIVNNEADDGGALFLSESAPLIVNSLIAYNATGLYGTGTANTPTYRHNCVYGNADYDFTGLTYPVGSDGNLSVDPCLANPGYRNMRIQPDSPCIDAGNNADVYGEYDIDEQPRIQSAGGTVDIGADESDGTCWSTGPNIIVRISPDGDDANDGSSWDLAKRTVQAGVDAASNMGGEIWVKHGVYLGQITLHPYASLYGGFSGNETDREQRDWNLNVTILNGGYGDTITANTVSYGAVGAIDGFTITHDDATYGAGIVLAGSDPIIANNKITNNTRGGLRISRSSPIVMNNLIAHNSKSGLTLSHAAPLIHDNAIIGNSSMYGGGLYLDHSNPIVLGNVISDNLAQYNGGGIHMTYSSAMILNNTIAGNSAQEFSGGGMCLEYSSDSIVANNVISGNSARGGGGMLIDYSSTRLVNNTITDNYATLGGGMYLHSSSPTIANTIIARNSSGIFKEGSVGIVTMRYNCVHGNKDFNYSGLEDPVGSNGNISEDPLLADSRYGNVHIQPDSPCIDAGNNDDADEDFDIDFQPRIHPDGGVIDIGADESNGYLWPYGPYTIVHVRPDGDDAYDGLSWDSALRTVQAGIDTASRSGGEVWVQAGTYPERIVLHPYAYLYGGFNGSELARSERDYKHHVTILDGEQRNSVVTARAGWNTCSTVDGFTIINGKAAEGGGICSSLSSPIIANNMIMYNCAADQGALGGGILIHYSNAIVINNIIAGNHMEGTLSAGSGVSILYSNPVLINNTIARNTLEGESTYGGGIFLMDSTPLIANSIIAYNGSGIYRQGTMGSPVFLYNCVSSNTEYNFSGLPDPTGQAGNISVPPLFLHLPGADLNFGDLRLRPTSPCIDAADNTAVPPDLLDLDGDGDTTEPLPIDLAGYARFIDDSYVIDTGIPGEPPRPVVDMGAYETCVGDLDGDGIVDLADLAQLLGHYGMTAGAAYTDGDMNGDGAVTLSDLAALLGVYGRDCRET